MSHDITPDEIIDALGGTSEVARLCEIQPPSVSGWRKLGIPKAQLNFLKLARPAVFVQLGLADVVAGRRATNPAPEPGRASRAPASHDRMPTFAAAQPEVVEPKA